MSKPRSNDRVIPARPAGHAPAPPGRLGRVGMSLWTDVISSYDFSERASLETLYQACAAADRAEKLPTLIDRDGDVVKTKVGLRDHPALKHEIACRSFVVRTLARLGLDLEPVQSVGRPMGIV